MREIKLTVRGDTVHTSRHRAGIQGECNATTLVVSFDESWDGYDTKKITFWDALGQDPVVKWLSKDPQDGNVTRTYQTTIPGEPLKEAGECTLVIDGLRGKKTDENEFVADARARSISVRLTVEEAPEDDKEVDPDDPRLDKIEEIAIKVDDGAARAERAADEAKEYALHSPYIGDNGTWWTWKDGAPTDTGAPSRGIQGERGLSGVYVGSGEMPEGYDVQIDPTGEIITVESLAAAVWGALPAAEGVAY